MTELEKRFLNASGMVVVEGMRNVQEIGIQIEQPHSNVGGIL